MISEVWEGKFRPLLVKNNSLQGGLCVFFLIIALRMMRLIRASVVMESFPTCTKYEFKGVYSSGHFLQLFNFAIANVYLTPFTVKFKTIVDS